MMKMFVGMNRCPYVDCKVDSPNCRKCRWFARPGPVGSPFIWCEHPLKDVETKRKRGRPKKSINGANS